MKQKKVLKNCSFIISFLFTLLSIFGTAQQVAHYSVSDGLAHQQVKALYQDSKCYLWIGTWDGVSRFDGHSFTTWRHDSNDSATIFNDEVKHITEDSTHTIWVITQRGPAKFNALHNNFERVYLKKSESLHYAGISANPIAFDHNNRGWFLDMDGLIGFNNGFSEIKHYDLSSFYVSSGSIMADSNGLWMGVREGLFYFTFETMERETKLDRQLADQVYPYSDSAKIDCRGYFLRTSGGRFLTNSNIRQLYISDDESGSMEKFLLPLYRQEKLFEYFGDLYEFSPSQIGLCTDDKGIQILNIQTNRFEFGHPVQDMVGEQTVYELFRDRQQNYWVGTQNGLYKYQSPQLDFDAWLYQPDSTNTLSGSFVSSIFLDNDSILWAACKGGGLDRINLHTNTISKINLDAIAGMVGSVNNVRYVYGVGDELLILEVDSKLLSYNKVTNTSKFLLDNLGSTYKIFKDQKNRLWFGDGHSIFTASIHNDAISVSDTILHAHQRCRDIFESRKNEMFFATEKGLIKLDSAAPGLLKTYLPPGSEMDPEILCIHENRDGALWLGSIRNGIYLFDPRQEKFIKHFTTEDGLIDNSVNAFMKDEHGYLWLSTWKGIVRFDPVNETFENYGQVHGLPVWDFTTGAYLWDDEGLIYFGGMGGVVRFHPDTFVRFMPQYDLQIVGVNANNQQLSFDYPLSDDELITLGYDQHDVSLEFSSFDFRNPDQRIYRCKLNGFDTDWILTRNNDFNARYSGISPGLYAFEMQTSYRGWPWVGEKNRLMIRIKPPPVLQRRGFQTGILVALGLALTSLIILRMRFLNMRKEVLISRLEKDANQSRLNFLKSQMNPHFYFNTLNAINSFVLKHEIREANRFLTTFAKLMREILENSQKEFVQISEETQVLEKYLSLQQLRFTGLFDYRVEADDDVAQMLIPPMLLQPFVENSVEYAFMEMKDKGFLQVRFASAAGGVRCVVQDNGIGIERSKQIKQRTNRKSTAIQNIYKRIKLLNAIYGLAIRLEISDLDASNDAFPGTSITLLLPDFDKVINKK